MDGSEAMQTILIRFNKLEMFALSMLKMQTGFVCIKCWNGKVEGWFRVLGYPRNILYKEANFGYPSICKAITRL